MDLKTQCFSSTSVISVAGTNHKSDLVKYTQTCLRQFLVNLLDGLASTGMELCLLRDLYLFLEKFPCIFTGFSTDRFPK